MPCRRAQPSSTAGGTTPVAVGMPDFTDKLTPEQVEKIKAFIQGTADAIRPKN